MNGRDITVRITSGSVIMTLLFIVLAVLLWYLRDVVLILLTAIVLASAMEPGIKAFMRVKVPRVMSVILMYMLVLGTFLGTALFFVPPVLNDAANFILRLPDMLGAIDFSSAPGSSWFPLSDLSTLLSSADLLRTLQSSLLGPTGGAVSTLLAIFGGLEAFILVVVFSFYFCVQETGVDDFLRIITPVKKHAYILNLWKRSQEKIGKWMQGQLLLGFLVGVLLYLGLVILGVPYALLLAVIAALCELIPVFGQFIAAIPIIAIAFMSGGTGLAFLAAGLILVIQQFESHLIYPLVVKKIVGVPPLLVILALIVGAKLAGFIGILLSVPIAAALREFVDDVEVRRASEELARGNTEA